MFILKINIWFEPFCYKLKIIFIFVHISNSPLMFSSSSETFLKLISLFWPYLTLTIWTIRFDSIWSKIQPIPLHFTTFLSRMLTFSLSFFIHSQFIYSNQSEETSPLPRLGFRFWFLLSFLWPLPCGLSSVLRIGFYRSSLYWSLTLAAYL